LFAGPAFLLFVFRAPKKQRQAARLPFAAI